MRWLTDLPHAELFRDFLAFWGALLLAQGLLRWVLARAVRLWAMVELDLVREKAQALRTRLAGWR